MTARLAGNLPERVFDFGCGYVGLTSLEGCPKHVERDFTCASNKLESLVGGPEFVGGKYDCTYNPLTTLDGIANTIEGILLLSWSENLPMLKILKYNFRISGNFAVQNLMKKYIDQRPLRQAIIQCQKELIDAGFVGNAHL